MVFNIAYMRADRQTDRQTDRNTSHARTHAHSPGAKKLGDFANLKPRRAHSHPVQTSTGPSWACSLKTTFASDTAFPAARKGLRVATPISGIE